MDHPDDLLVAKPDQKCEPESVAGGGPGPSGTTTRNSRTVLELLAARGHAPPRYQGRASDTKACSFRMEKMRCVGMITSAEEHSGLNPGLPPQALARRRCGSGRSRRVAARVECDGRLKRLLGDRE